jgi:TrmH family RNA methyltransferase
MLRTKEQTMTITSLQNQRIKAVIKLHQRKYRDQQQTFLIEGYRAIRRALTNGYPLIDLYYCPALFFGKDEPALIRQVAATGAAVIEMAEAPFQKLAYRQRPEGLLAVAPQCHRRLADHHPADDGFYLIAESIEKPVNLGAILRSADGAGASGVIVCDPRTDLFNPNVVRASVGAFFTIPLLESSTAAAVSWCRANGVRILASTPQAELIYTSVDMRGAVALVVGTEQYGLSRTWLDQADERLRLPMLGQADSLNVAMAAALLLYEAVRQRR